MNKYIKITWTNACPINDILFNLIDPFNMYIDGEIVRPSYETEEDGAENGDNEFIPTFQKVTKNYNLVISPLIESQVDALHIMSLCDTVTIVDKNFTVYTVKQGSVKLVTEWITEDYASVKMAFETDETIIRNNCCE